MSRTAFRTCPFCEATCGLAIELDAADVITAVRGDADDPFSRGYICPKGAAFKAYHEDPDRLRAPLIKRDGEHVEVSWDEAFARVEAELTRVVKEGGRDAIGIYAGNPSAHNLAGSLYGRALIKALKTKNLFTASTVDQMPKHLSSGLLFGHPMSVPVPDLDRTDYLLMLGANPAESNGSMCTAPDFMGRLRRIRERGGKVVVVDPRRTRTAGKASEHLFIRPGGDAALLCALAKVLIDEGLTAVPDEMLSQVSGLDALTAALADLPLAALSGRCGIAADTIERIARELAGAPTAAVYGRLGTTTVELGTLASAMVDVLNLLTGNLDRPGGAMFALAAHASHRPNRAPGGRGFETGRWSSRVDGHPEVMSELPAAALAAEIETPGDGQIRALITVAGNPVLSNPNAGRLDAALPSLEFMVSIDPYLNETTRHADVILPPSSHLTQSAYHLVFYQLAVRNVAHYAPPAVDVPDGSLDEAQILMKLAAIASGQGAAASTDTVDNFILMQVVGKELSDPESPLAGLEIAAVMTELSGRRGADRLLDFLVRAGPYGDHLGRRLDGLSLAVLEDNPHGVDLGPLEPRLPALLSTPTGTIELWHPIIEGELARLRGALDDPPPRFSLIGRRHLRSNNSWMHNLPKLAVGKPRCTLLINPADAAEIGVADGDPVAVLSRVGEVQIAAELTDDIMEGVVSIPHGWGHGIGGTRLRVAAEHPGVNTNLLTDETVLDGPSGNAVLNGIEVENPCTRSVPPL